VPWTATTSALFDRLESGWHSAAARRLVADSLVAIFLLALVAIELARRGLLPHALAGVVPANHFYAVEIAFYLLLAYEVVGLVFGIARSVANAAGKQLEIFSLILLRQSFEAFGHVPEPLTWLEVRGTALQMLCDCAGALGIFVLLGFYYRLQRHQPLSSDTRDRDSFIAAKKLIALALLVVFAVLGTRAALGQILFRERHRFFETLYTILIFADILVVLLSSRYSSTYRVVFRISGVAVSTVLLRLALSAPPMVNALLGVGAALFAVGLTIAYNGYGSLAAQPQASAGPDAAAQRAPGAEELVLPDQRASQPSPATVPAAGLYSQPTQPR
jgi:hypothetical protein